MTPEAMLGWTPFSYPFNLTQQPACTIPCGFTSDGLPIGLQLVGPMFATRSCCAPRARTRRRGRSEAQPLGPGHGARRLSRAAAVSD
jgi:Asp-tRNA(Asn)/Glu-tRNA(Gln) amidotransferase A subunit family amidase